tara:strand:- start:44 stop:211 length:168 start_codon:yes stop_codon:yes gene_type:complete
MNLNSLDGIVEELDYHLLWYKWMTKICPTPKEMADYDKLDKKEQINYLKEKVNGK